MQELFAIRIHHGYILQIILAELLFFPVLKRRNYFILRFVLGFIAYGALSIVISNLINMVASGLNSLSIFIISLGFCALIFKNHFKDVLFCCVGAQFIQNLSHNFEMLIYLPLKDHFNDVGWFFLSFGVMLVTYALAFFIIVRRLIGNNEIAIHNAGVFGIAIASAIFCYLVQYLFQYYKIDSYWVTTLPFIFCGIVSLIAQFGLLAYRRRIEENAKLESYISRESQMYDNFKDTIDVINMKAHDLKHFIADIDRNGAKSFDGLEEIKQAVEKYEMTSNTGNATLDTVLTEKMYVCQKNNIQFSLMVDGDALSFMKNADIASVFGNGLSNAIEYENGIEDSSKRSIFLKVYRKGDMTSIHVENYCDVKPKLFNGLPITTKENKNEHGFGLKSIRYIAKKYNGTMTVSCYDNLFCLDVLLPFSKNDD